MPIFSDNWDRLYPVCLQYRFRTWAEYLSLIAMLVCGFDYKYKGINEINILSGKLLGNINGWRFPEENLKYSRFESAYKAQGCAFFNC